MDLCWKFVSSSSSRKVKSNYQWGNGCSQEFGFPGPNFVDNHAFCVTRTVRTSFRATFVDGLLCWARALS
jgi:hypothetical protein